jgi:hypothetical protein
MEMTLHSLQGHYPNFQGHGFIAAAKTHLLIRSRPVTPAQAGVQCSTFWIPAYAGMTYSDSLVNLAYFPA